MSVKQDLAFASALLRECRKFIDNIVPGCAAGHDELISLKGRIDLFYFEVDSRLLNPEDNRAALRRSGASDCSTAEISNSTNKDMP